MRVKVEEETPRDKLSEQTLAKMAEENSRMMIYEKVYKDENGNKISNHYAYKDLMVFFRLIERDMFGGRVMINKVT